MEVQHHENDQRGAFIIPENGERLGELTYVWQGEDKFAIDHTRSVRQHVAEAWHANCLMLQRLCT